MLPYIALVLVASGLDTGPSLPQNSAMEEEPTVIEELQESPDDVPFHGSLPADHPMLQQAQEKLKEQLLATKQRLEEELQERKYAIKVPPHVRAAACQEKCVLY